MLKVSIRLGEDRFDAKGSEAEVLPLIAQWLSARNAALQKQIDQLTERLAAANTQLSGVVDTTKPESQEN